MSIHTNHPQPLETFDEGEVAQVSLKVFSGLTQAWDLSRDQALMLLGCPNEQTLNGWRDDSISPLPNDALERISVLLGIYKATHSLLPLTEHANAWLKRPNAAFDGDSALDVMLNGRLEDLYRVRRYLDAMLCYD